MSFQKIIILFGFVLIPYFTDAQSISGKVGGFDFNNCDDTDLTGNGNEFVASAPAVTCGCGIGGQALKLDGTNSYEASGSVTSFLSRTGFSMSFFFKPQGGTGIEYLFSKQLDCSQNKALNITYNNTTKTIGVSLSENQVLSNRLSFRAASTCWNHLLITSKFNVLKAYVNGVLVGTSTVGTTNILINNNVNPRIGYSPCPNASNFKGLIDEFTVFSRELSAEEAKSVYQFNKPDIINQNIVDKVIWLGESTPTQLLRTCGVSYQWLPTTGVSDATIKEPVLAPTVTTTYRVIITDENGCQSIDTTTIKVNDPDKADCSRVMLPKAFTPNGDLLNDVLKIDNGPVLDVLKSFEIYDRNGNQLFFTNDKSVGWDGKVNGKDAPPATYLARVIYECNGVERVFMQDLTLIH